MAVLYLLLGLGGLLLGSDLAVRGSVSLAHRFGWPSWMTGLVLLALGTSLPELFVSATSAGEHPELAFGNIFGSNAFNVGLVLGAALIFKGQAPLHARSVGLPSLIPLLFGSILIFFIEAAGQSLMLLGVALLLAYVAMTTLAVLGRGELEKEGDASPSNIWSLGPATLGTLAGFVVLAFAARFFLDGALEIADDLGWSEGFAGFIITAAGTSAPELFTSLRALRLGHAGAIFGNVVGSNAFNLLIAGGTVCLIAPSGSDFRGLDPQLWVNLACTMVLLVPAVVHPAWRELSMRADRFVGGLLCAGWLVAALWIHAG
ncbi:MAG: sodium:calcium antiporter [Planctomycetota bacterium]|jgi:cation:H+ antiporter